MSARDFHRFPLRVLLVEDDKIFGESLRLYLEMDDRVEVVGVVDRLRATLASATTTIVELALVDVNLGLDSGYAIAETLRDLRPEIVVVMMSALDSDEVREAALRSGAAAAVDKSSFVTEGRDIVLGLFLSALAARREARPGAA